MVKSTRSSLEEEVYDDKELHATIYAPSHNNDAKGTEQQLSTRPRSKHSATEQRRRSKINERFQILRDLIPQNDQKRDKASFLLEVIEYIHFLQEKLQIYEGPIQAWGQETTKLMPHRNNHEPLETYPDPFQVIANGSAQENNVSTPSIANAQNLVQSDFGVDAAYRVMDHPHWSDTQTAVHMPLQPNMFSARSGIPLYPLQGTVTDADRMVAQDHCHLDQLTGGSMECSVPSNTLQGQECRTENRLDSISSACSEGLLHTLTQALQSSGVDMSQANISVQIDVGKQTHGGESTTALGQEDDNNLYSNNQALAHSLVASHGDCDQALKRIRREHR